VSTPDDNRDDPWDLARFHEAQRGTWEGALDELRRGRKTGHWIWFVFPQLRGLGRSPVSAQYAIRSIAEARAYLADPVLSARLHQGAEALLAAQGTADGILGSLDAMKVRSSMTLFHRAAPADPAFRAVLERFWDGRPDPLTDRLLAEGPGGTL
jgi:uncharacterized protein (DUF1810 family)